jgi:hypothetical protein
MDQIIVMSTIQPAVEHHGMYLKAQVRDEDERATGIYTTLSRTV